MSPGKTAAPRSGTLRLAWSVASGILLAAAFALDCASGNEVTSSLFYMVGIAVAAWFVGMRAAVAVACLSTVAWAAAVHLVGPGFSRASVYAWNLAVELAIYLATGVVLARIHFGLQAERRLVIQLDAARAALAREARAVGDLQREMLPVVIPPVPGYAWQVHYTTSSDAGGDYYDFFPLPDGSTGILVADASGHGAQAAVVMAMLRVLMHATREALAPPEHVLARLGGQIAQVVPCGRFATACYAILDPASGSVRYSLAGHPAPLVLRADSGAVDELPLCGGPPLGLKTQRPFDAGTTALAPGDTLVVYTDGLTECSGPDRELFGEERLREALEGGERLALETLLRRVLARVEHHAAGASREDDLTILMLRRSR